MRTTSGCGSALRALLLLLLVVPLLACGVRAQDQWEPVPGTSVLPAPDDPQDRGGQQDVSVYFVSGSRLAFVPRSAVDRRPQTAIDLLLAGPSRREVMTGLRTALSPQHLLVLSGPDGSGTAAVAVNRAFTGITGGNQVLAVAQVVWTVTQFSQIDRLYFLFDGEPVEVPTDDGLTGQPVDRSDYATVAPRPVEPAPAPSTTPAEGTGSRPPDARPPDAAPPDTAPPVPSEALPPEALPSAAVPSSRPSATGADSGAPTASAAGTRLAVRCEPAVDRRPSRHGTVTVDGG